MRKTNPALAILVLAGLLPLAALADKFSPQVRTRPASLCDCGCSATKMAPGCTRVCKPPKSHSQWWATPCQKRPASRPSRSPDSSPYAPDDDPEMARR